MKFLEEMKQYLTALTLADIENITDGTLSDGVYFEERENKFYLYTNNGYEKQINDVEDLFNEFDFSGSLKLLFKLTN